MCQFLHHPRKDKCVTVNHQPASFVEYDYCQLLVLDSASPWDSVRVVHESRKPRFQLRCGDFCDRFERDRNMQEFLVQPVRFLGCWCFIVAHCVSALPYLLHGVPRSQPEQRNCTVTPAPVGRVKGGLTISGKRRGSSFRNS